MLHVPALGCGPTPPHSFNGPPLPALSQAPASAPARRAPLGEEKAAPLPRSAPTKRWLSLAGSGGPQYTSAASKPTGTSATKASPAAQHAQALQVLPPGGDGANGHASPLSRSPAGLKLIDDEGFALRIGCSAPVARKIDEPPASEASHNPYAPTLVPWGTPPQTVYHKADYPRSSDGTHGLCIAFFSSSGPSPQGHERPLAS